MPLLYTFESFGVADCVSEYTRALTNQMVDTVRESPIRNSLSAPFSFMLRSIIPLSLLELDVSSACIAQLPVLSWMMNLTVQVTPSFTSSPLQGAVDEITQHDLIWHSIPLDFEDEPRGLACIKKVTMELTIKISQRDYLTGRLEILAAEKLTSFFAHEVHHVYDMYKQILANRQTRDYRLNSIITLGQRDYPALNMVLMPIYLAFNHEMNARVSQVYAQMREANVPTQEEFMRLLKKQPEYKHMLIMRKFKTNAYIQVLKDIKAVPDFYRFLAGFNEAVGKNPVLLAKIGKLETMDAFFNFFCKQVQRRAELYRQKLVGLYPRIREHQRPLDQQPEKPQLP